MNEASTVGKKVYLRLQLQLVGDDGVWMGLYKSKDESVPVERPFEITYFCYFQTF